MAAQEDGVAIGEPGAATMTRTVQRLERAGFVRRTPSPTDRRAVIVESTPAGHALRSQVERIWQAPPHSSMNGPSPPTIASLPMQSLTRR
ncbi:MarR family transcriptional regulator [Amycolatopsis sp. NPDC024027]|uniref:MarR family winged helix-turn-helix transcriptional regulator n=1 Tax=Amycolatopsis sp. NPDC024027 TaxID=3154327 RepID=UPI0033E4B695